MAKHKAASQVSIASTEEETAFSDVVKSYGKPALLLALVVSAVILYLDWTKKQAQVATVEGWEELGRDGGEEEAHSEQGDEDRDASDRCHVGRGASSRSGSDGRRGGIRTRTGCPTGS